jgi:hypothetical protein
MVDFKTGTETRLDKRPHTMCPTEVFANMIPRNGKHTANWFVRGFILLLETVTLLWVAPHPAQARITRVLSYQEMFAKSDLVVIANPINKTTDTKERAFLPGIFQQEKDGSQSKVESIGVETVFAVSVVLKGNATVKQFKLHHYREAQASKASNGPILVRFDPSDISKRSSYLLFLVREPDGRFASTDGQTDPGMKAISPIPFDVH